MGIYYASKMNNSPRLEATLAKDWLISVFGPENYDKLWDPLLRSKLGAASPQISASFIQAYIHRLYGTRKNGSKKETVGCVRGGYHAILVQLQQKIGGRRGKIQLNQQVRKIAPLANGKLRIYCRGEEFFDFDKVISAVPNAEVGGLVPNLPNEFKEQLREIRYLKIVCATLVLKRPLSPFYVMNLTDSGFPFTGVIEASHLIPNGLLGNKGLLYLPRYMAPDDPFYEKSDQEILEIFGEALKRIFPGFSFKDVVGQILNRELNVQPIQEVNYSAHIPPMKTPLKNFYIVNTTMIRNSSLNNNQVIQLARKAVQQLLEPTT
jgi:protoporphyrinogen oxidase